MRLLENHNNELIAKKSINKLHEKRDFVNCYDGGGDTINNS